MSGTLPSSAIGHFVIGESPIGGAYVIQPGAPIWRDTILAQYANSPTIVQLVANMDAYFNPDADILAFYNLVWNVNSAVGYGLDVWGRIVGVGRVLQVASVAYFGMTGTLGASGDPFNVSPFYNGQPVTSNYTLSDAAYRVLILAKALANICDSSIGAINQILINVFGQQGPLPITGNSYVTDGENMTMTYTFSGPLDPLQQAIIFQSGVFPKPAGVASTVVHP